MALPLLKVGSKLGISIGAVYVTVQQGVWTPSSSLGSKVSHSVQDVVLPATNEYIESLPRTQDITAEGVSKWNSGVQSTFEVLSRSPELVTDYGKKGLQLVKDNILP